MYNLVMKDLKLGLNPMFFVLPVLTGALMLVPGWLYFIVILYFCWITIPIMFAGYKNSERFNIYYYDACNQKRHGKGEGVRYCHSGIIAYC